MSIIIPGQEKTLNKATRYALIFIGIELVAFGLSPFLDGFLSASFIVLPIFYGVNILRKLIK